MKQAVATPAPTLSDSSETMTTQTSLPLFYEQPRPLAPGAHANLSLAGNTGFGYAAKTNAVPLVATELPTACRHFPIVFTDGDQPTPVAVLGVRGQENLFVDAQGQWRAGAYIPAYVRRYPFIFMENEDRSQFTLCVDEKAASVVEGRDNPFFDEAGEPTDLARSCWNSAATTRTSTPTRWSSRAPWPRPTCWSRTAPTSPCPTASAWPCPASK